MAGRFGGKWVFGIGMLAVAIAALLIPVAARTNYILVIILRIIQGLGEVSAAKGGICEKMTTPWG